MPHVTIVSNRLPISVKRLDNGKLGYFPSIGGLATGLSSIASTQKSNWIGWPGITSDEITEKEKHAIARRLAISNCYPVFLSKKQLDAYYNGYSNSILWPFFHNSPADYDSHEKNWKVYKEVNALFTNAVISMTAPKDTVWVHDYQLMLMPALLRAERPYATIGFFLHIPFPQTKLVVKLPHALRLLEGLLGSDLVGFQTNNDVRNFLNACTELNVGIPSDSGVILKDRIVRVTDFPISIDYTKFADANNSELVQEEVKLLKEQYRGKKIILTIDRLDPTKGLVGRVLAYQEFLAKNPKQHGKVVMVMLAMPSRTDIKAYRDLKKQLESLIKGINKTYGTAKWQPIDYIYNSFPFEKVAALYQIADVAFIAPLRDGMNLVAKEYIASKQAKPGALILSQTAGAAQELTDAIIVNPLQHSSLVRALTKAMTMTDTEMKERAKRMQKHLASHTIQQWAGGFTKTLHLAQNFSLLPTIPFRPALQKQLVSDYLGASSRLILLDYDGVLSPFFGDPSKAVPSVEITNLLVKLASDKANKVVIISGRSRDDLDKWFGNLPVALAAEHGALIREAGEQWQEVVRPFTKWKQIIRPVLEKYAAKTPGAFVEEKETSLVWHYRKAAPYYAQRNIVILKRALKPALKQFGVKVHSGNKIIEIKSPEANKGVATQRWLEEQPDLVIAIGDDYTDEDMFIVLPLGSYTIKVGRGRTRAAYRLGSVSAVIKLLKRLA